MAARRHGLAAPLATAAAAAAAWAAVMLLGPERAMPLPCPLLTLIGVACPLCGGTRAIYELSHGDLVGAAGHNLAAVVAAPVLAGLWLRWLFGRVRGERAPPAASSNRTMLVVAAALLAFTVARNLPPGAWLAP